MDEQLYGLLGINPEDLRRQSMTQGLLSAGLNMLAASGPSSMPVGLGQVVAQGGNAFMQAQQAAQQQAMQGALQRLQTEDFFAKRATAKEQQTRQSAINAAMKLPMDQRITKLQELGAYDVIKSMADSATAARRAGLVRPEGVAVENPFLPYIQAQSPQVRQLAQTYSQGFEIGRIDEETADKRIQDLSKMEDSYLSRVESKADREERDRLARLEREQRDALARQERQIRQIEQAEEREIKRKEGTEGQKLSAGFANRMVRSQNILNTFEQEGVGLPTTGTSFAGGVPFVGGYLERQMMDTDQQRYKQAAMNWIRANLRKESGAAIGDEEAAQEYATYFPLPGDDPETIRQKRDARNATTQAMIINAGPVFEMPTLAPVETSKKKGKSGSIFDKFKLEPRK